MDKDKILSILSCIKDGTITPEEAVSKLKILPFEELGFAKVDHHRSIRQGASEVIYGQGKTAKQIQEISNAMMKNGEKSILITRLEENVAEILNAIEAFCYYPEAKIGVIGTFKEVNANGYILVITAGTSDIPVALEACLTAEFLGNKVEKLFDVGVAGIHRLLSNLDIVFKANVVITVAGMEGALASVVGGLCDCPVIGVPTSIGYGASFGGLSALLTMLNSCASGVSVVNIDNGFGAGYLASIINHRSK